MLRCYSVYPDEKYYSPQTYMSLSVIESCDQALSEGASDTRVIDTVLSYTQSTTLEILENVKEALLQLCSLVLSALNNFILNNAKYIDRYREFLKERVQKLDPPFIYEGYDYKIVKDYPHVVKSAVEVESKVIELQSHIRSDKWTDAQIMLSVDHILEWFSSRVLDEECDPDRIKPSVKEIVTRRIRGEKATPRGLDARNIDKFIDEIKLYRDHMNDIKKTKANILADYELLKWVYKKAIVPPPEVQNYQNNRLASIYDPEYVAFLIHEKDRFMDINTQMSRMLNGFIQIYEVAFDTKLNLLKERVDFNRTIITELLKRIQLTPLINAKRAEGNRKPFKNEPSIIT